MASGLRFRRRFGGLQRVLNLHPAVHFRRQVSVDLGVATLRSADVEIRILIRFRVGEATREFALFGRQGLDPGCQ